VCLLGASWARQHILNAHPDANVTVFAIWMPMLSGDARSEWDSNVLNDRRVVSLWDPDRLAGLWFAEHGTGNLGGPGYPVWDAFFAFGKSGDDIGTPLASGSTIIDNTGTLEQRFVPLLER
jgi:hypothetical protein